MTVAIDSDSAIINGVRFTQQAGDPTAPSAGGWLLYFKAAGLFYRASGGGVTQLFADPTTTEGDLVYRHSGAVARLAIGASGKVLTSNGTDPSWADPTDTFAGEVTALDFNVTGLPGATTALRLVGATGSGAPATGTFAMGDVVLDFGGAVFRVCTVAGSPGSWSPIGLASGLTTEGDLLFLSGGLPTRLAVGTSGQVLTSDGTDPGWTTLSALTNPMTTRGDIIVEDASPAPARLAVGAANSVLKSNGTDPSWTTAPTLAGLLTALGLIASGLTGATTASRYVGGVSGAAPATGTFLLGDFAIDQTGYAWVCTAGGSPGTWVAVGFHNPMTTQDDLLVGGASGAPARLAKGTDGQVLTVSASTHHLDWETPAAGLADPTTTKGDLIVHGASTTRLAVGSDGKVLTANSGVAAGVDWETPSAGFSNPMTTRGDLLVEAAGPAAGRLAVGSAGQRLKSDGTDPGWGDDLVDVNFVIDGGGSVLVTGTKGYVQINQALTIVANTLLADQSGSVVVNVYKCTYAQFDAGSTHPVVGDKITSSTPPTITTATKSTDSTLSSWTLAISAGDILAFTVDSVTTIQRVTCNLKCKKAA